MEGAAAGAGRPGAALDGGYVRLWIAHRYCAAGFARQLADADMAVRRRRPPRLPGAARCLPGAPLRPRPPCCCVSCCGPAARALPLAPLSPAVRA